MVCVVCSASFIKKEENIMMRTHESSTDVAAQAKPRYESIRGCHFSEAWLRKIPSKKKILFLAAHGSTRH